MAWQNKLESFTQDNDGVSVQVIGPSEVRRQIRTRWLVGCDGSRSAVRHCLGLSFEGGDYEEAFLLADVHIDWSMPDDEMVMELTPEGPLVAFPLPEPGRWRLVDTTGVIDAKDPESIVARFRDLLTSYVAPGAAVDAVELDLFFSHPPPGGQLFPRPPLLCGGRRRTRAQPSGRAGDEYRRSGCF